MHEIHISLLQNMFILTDTVYKEYPVEDKKDKILKSAPSKAHKFQWPSG